MEFRSFLIETQTISQYIKTQKEFPPELYKAVKNEIRNSLASASRLNGNALERYVNWGTYWGMREYFDNPQWGTFRKKEFAVNPQPITTQPTSTPSKNKDDEQYKIQITAEKIARAGSNAVQFVGDYIVAHLNDNNIQSKFNTIEYTPEQAKIDSKEWHDELALKQSRPGGKGRLLLKLDRLGPQWTGWRWLSLERGYCGEEADAAGHCGNANAREGDNIFSLRDPQNHVHLTFIVNNGILGEMKGRGNHKPSPKYHGPIVELLKSKNVGSIFGGGWDPDNNFHLNDLPKETQEALLKKKPLLANPFKYATQSVTDDKKLLDTINSLFEDGIESVRTENGVKVAVIESFEDWEDVDNRMCKDSRQRAYPNCNMESVRFMDEPWSAFEQYDQHHSDSQIRDFVEDELDQDTTELLNQYVNKALQEKQPGNDEPWWQTMGLENEDEMSLFEKLQEEDDEVMSAVRMAVSDAETAGTENDAYNHVKKELGNPDNKGFYLAWPVTSKKIVSGKSVAYDGIELRINLPDLEKVYNSGQTSNPKEAVEIDYSQPYSGYGGFDRDTFNERLKEALREIKWIDVNQTEMPFMKGENMKFEDWLIIREGLGKWNASKKRHEPISKYKGSWADEEEQRKKKGLPIPIKDLPKLPSERAVKIKAQP